MGTHLCFSGGAPGDDTLLFPVPLVPEEARLEMVVSIHPLSRLQDKGNWCQEEAESFLRLRENLARHPTLGFVSRCLAYNLCSGGWARGIRKGATAQRMVVRFTNGVSEETIEQDGLLEWKPWAVAKPSQAKAGMPDPCEEHAATIAPLARVIHSALSGESPFALITVRELFTLPADSPLWQRNRRISPDYIAKALRTFDRFHTSQIPDVVLPIEPDGWQDRLKTPVRSAQELFLPLLRRGMAEPASLTVPERYYLIGMFLRGGWAFSAA